MTRVNGWDKGKWVGQGGQARAVRALIALCLSNFTRIMKGALNLYEALARGPIQERAQGDVQR